MIYLSIYLSIGLVICASCFIHDIAKKAIDRFTLEDALMAFVGILFWPIIAFMMTKDMVENIKWNPSKIVLWERKVPPVSSSDQIPE